MAEMFNDRKRPEKNQLLRLQSNDKQSGANWGWLHVAARYFLLAFV